eukprot:GHRR01007055.1.p2 GENE.GHRR01007055.1~~GHRR01007055.1.p2  ORF type:complete len:189 (+),score=48.45 GHRR01007055.1:238-804(+)
MKMARTSSTRPFLLTHCVWLLYLIAISDAWSISSYLGSSCPEKAAPVCGSDGLTYYNDCLAAVQNVEVAYEGYCEDAFFKFAGASVSVAVTEAAQKASSMTRRMVPKERATAQLSNSLVNAYSEEGFVYVGKAKLASRPTPRHSNGSSSQQLSTLPDWVTAVRFTPEGHVYVARRASQERATAATVII